MKTLVDLIGQKFGRLTVLRKTTKAERAKTGWLCQCECGSFRINNAYNLNKGIVKSCGCLRNENNKLAGKNNATHGATTSGKISREYKAWQSMKGRVSQPGHYQNIEVYDSWRNSFYAFLCDMGKAPSDDHQVDRIDNSKGYSPDNCRWATSKENQRNRTNNRIIEWNGRSMCLAAWEEELNPLLGLKERAIKMRLNKLGWTVEKAFTTPCCTK
jgi:hypothetical protein